MGKPSKTFLTTEMMVNSWDRNGAKETPAADSSDEVRISNIARSEQEIQELMNKGIEGVLAVKPQDKLTTTWGKLKARR